MWASYILCGLMMQNRILNIALLLFRQLPFQVIVVGTPSILLFIYVRLSSSIYYFTDMKISVIDPRTTFGYHKHYWYLGISSEMYVCECLLDNWMKSVHKDEVDMKGEGGEIMYGRRIKKEN